MTSRHSQALRTAAKWTTLASLMGAVFNFAFNAVLTNFSSPKDVGTLFAWLAIASVLAQFFQGGFQTACVRGITLFTSQDLIHDAYGYVKKLLCVLVLHTVSIIFLCILLNTIFNFTFFLEYQSHWILFGILTYSIAFAWRTVLSSIDRSLGNAGRSTYLGVLLPAFLQLIFVFAFALSFQIDSADSLLFLVCCAHLLSLICCLIPIVASIRNGTKCNTGLDAIYLSGIVFLANSFVYNFFAQLGVLFLDMQNLQEQIALYGLPSRMIVTFLIPPMLLLQFISPSVAKHIHLEDFEAAQTILKSSSTLCSIYVLCLVLFFLVVGEMFFSILFGSYYVPSVDVLLILLFGSLISFPMGFGVKAIELSDKKNWSMIPGITAIVISLLSLSSLYSAWGVNGVALSISIGVVLNRLTGSLLAYYLLGLNCFGFANVKPIFSQYRSVS